MKSCTYANNIFSSQDERLATEALKSYADKFEPQQHPEDYKLVRKVSVDALPESQYCFAGYES